jgi:hypothetical protein
MKKNLLKEAGNRNFFYLQNFNPENRTWSRQTVYFTDKGFPILMTAQRKFFAKDPSTGRRDFKPKAFMYIKDAKPMRVTARTPLPRKLRQYRGENFDKSVDYINTNRADLYSIKRLTLKKHRQKQVATALKAMSALPQNVQRTIMSKVRKTNTARSGRPYSAPSPNYVPLPFLQTVTAVHSERPMSASNIKRHAKYRTQIKKVAQGNREGILKRFNERLRRASESARRRSA